MRCSSYRKNIKLLLLMKGQSHLALIYRKEELQKLLKNFQFRKK